MKGEKIAYLIVEWANKQKFHPDDFSSLFVGELLEILEKDRVERIILKNGSANEVTDTSGSIRRKG